MTRKIIFRLLSVIIISNNTFSINVSKKTNDLNVEPADALFLTPYIEQGEIELARNKSEVYLDDFKNLKSFSGYLTVNKKECDSNLFFWFFPSKENYDVAPVIQYMNGGPGGSSIGASFVTNGPIEFVNGTPTLREISWNQKYSVLYIDHPIGAGFSFTDNDKCYRQTSFENADDVYEGLVQFFKLFPEIRSNGFYLSGVSYAGKFIPPIAYKIHQMNQKVDPNDYIFLKGLLIESGWSDPKNQLDLADYLYQLGFIDEHLKKKLETIQTETSELISKEKWREAFWKFNEILYDENSIYLVELGLPNYQNWFQVNTTASQSTSIKEYIKRNDIRLAMHTGNRTFHEQDLVLYNFIGDYMQSVAPMISDLLSNYRIVFFNGQLDVTCAYILTKNMLMNIEFPGKKEYLKAERHIWRLDDEVVGYTKQAGNLTEILVRNVGHGVVKENPKWAFELLNQFIENKFPK